jgi:uncharacterized membrane protein
MSDFTDWFDPNSAGGILAVIFGFGLLISLASEAPLVLLGLGTLVFLAWAGTRLDVFDTDGQAEQVEDRDPLKVLQERYARGEISEEEFEQRLTTVLNADELAGRDVVKSDRDRDLLTERT